ncbi:MAG: hypothetical protein ACKODK_11845 [Opitutaceae bacterium]
MDHRLGAKFHVSQYHDDIATHRAVDLDPAEHRDGIPADQPARLDATQHSDRAAQHPALLAHDGASENRDGVAIDRAVDRDLAPQRDHLAHPLTGRHDLITERCSLFTPRAAFAPGGSRQGNIRRGQNPGRQRQQKRRGKRAGK